MKNKEEKLSALDKALISLGLPKSKKGTKTGYSIIFSNKPIINKKTNND